jgi:hypothetical protein
MRENRKLTTIFSLVALLSMAVLTPISTADNPAEEDFLPTPGEVSSLVDDECGRLLLWELDDFGENVSNVWRQHYAFCAVEALTGSDILQRIGDHCQDIGAECVNQTLTDTGIGPQFAALFEACVFLNQIKQDTCSYETILGPLGPLPNLDLEDCCKGAGAPPPDLCQAGICLDTFIGVEHVGIGWPDLVCPGIQTYTEVEGRKKGWILNLGIFVAWDTQETVKITTDVEWEAACSVPIEIHGTAWGGFFRQLTINRNTEYQSVCKYDGIFQSECNGIWRETTSAGVEGAYNYEKNQGDKPPALLRVKAQNGGKWFNEGQESLQGINFFDIEDTVIGGSRNYPIAYQINRGTPDDKSSLAALPSLDLLV